MANNYNWNRRVAMLVRWLHIYLSMISFAIIFFFAVTGLTLKHADKFVSALHTEQQKGNVDTTWVRNPDTAKIDKLVIVEYLRKCNDINTAVSDFRIDDSQIDVSFKGPGFTADAFISRETGQYEVNKTSAGFIGLINDLHKGRDTGSAWSWVIDVSAVLLALVSLSGLMLLFFLKKKRLLGLLVAMLGGLLAWLVYLIWIQ
jgi:hypothetical protein